MWYCTDRKTWTALYECTNIDMMHKNKQLYLSSHIITRYVQSILFKIPRIFYSRYVAYVYFLNDCYTSRYCWYEISGMKIYFENSLRKLSIVFLNIVWRKLLTSFRMCINVNKFCFVSAHIRDGSQVAFINRQYEREIETPPDWVGPFFILQSHSRWYRFLWCLNSFIAYFEVW